MEDMSRHTDHGWNFDWVRPVCFFALSFPAVGFVGRKLAPDQILKEGENRLWRWHVIIVHGFAKF